MREKLQQRFDEASAKLARFAKGSSGDPLSMRRGIENNYSQAYEALAKIGAVPRLRGKYRG